MKIDRDTFVKAITEISERTEELYSDIQRSYDQLLKEVKGKRKKETKMTPNERCIAGLGIGHANIRDSSSSSPFPAGVGVSCQCLSSSSDRCETGHDFGKFKKSMLFGTQP